MAILVTGGAGFIGSQVCDALIQRGEDVVIIDDFNDYYDPAIKQRNIDHALSKGAELLHGDICDVNTLDQLPWPNIDRVIHLAARAGVRPSIAQPRLYWQTNVDGTMNLLEFARDHGVSAFVMASSSSVYGDGTQVPYREDDPAPQPISPYAASKRATELLAYTYHHLYKMNISCLRYFTVYGPRQRPEMAIHKFTRLIDQGEAVPMFGDGSMRRDYTYIDDIVSGTLATLDRCQGYEIFNLGGNRTTSLLKLIEMIGAALGKEPIIQRHNPQPGDVKQTYADIEKSKRLLGYEPHTPIEQGITRFVEWYRQQA